MTTVYEILDRLRADAIDERDKGGRFERLVQQWLMTDRKWSDLFEVVYQWTEWDGRQSDQDVGIDLVGIERDTGSVWAIQCKFYDENHHIDKNLLGTYFTELGKEAFTAGLVVTTSNNWSKHADEAFTGQSKSVTRIGLAELENSTVDWDTFSFAHPEELKLKEKKSLRPHQKKAIEAVERGFADHDRGKLIMACGTGKTFTSLKAAETMLPIGGTVLFLVPSISLLSQTLTEWTAESAQELKSFAVCSDVKVGKNVKDEDIQSFDLAYPATTNVNKLVENFKLHTKDFEGMTVVFSTYQSIDVVAKAQAEGLPEFDLIICDEAHRTTGVTLSEEDDSHFVKVHDDDFIKGRKRLYMTATPRVFGENVKAKAQEHDALLTSMDDESIYGPEFHRLMFGEAVSQGLLSDYKVVILTVSEKRVAELMATGQGTSLDLPIDEIARIIGCYNGLSKRSSDEGEFVGDPMPMRRAVAFASSIKASKTFEDKASQVIDQLVLTESDSESTRLRMAHVDGTDNVLVRNQRLEWLKADPTPGTVKVLSNARCLSEGVDVPALDAVLFLSPRNSVVDVVQSVGRVMRIAPGKNYGYVIVPVAVADYEDPKVALDDNKRFKTVWQVLQALRSHDERFAAEINQIDLDKKEPGNIIFVPGGGDEPKDQKDAPPTVLQLPLNQIEGWKDAVLAKIVAKVGERAYWENWTKDVATITQRYQVRIKAMVDKAGTEQQKKFKEFVKGLRVVLNPSVSDDAAIEMLAQHMVTKPVFDALFEGYSFSESNPVSQVMEGMISSLNGETLEAEAEGLSKFYDSVRTRVEGISSAAGKQQIIKELYDKFFQGAFKTTADKLGIVYTPVEVVDFMISSVERTLNESFRSSLGDMGVHILDPFTGTGTFIARILQSGFISTENLEHKYRYELHANEIVLLAYYIAAVNIEETFHAGREGAYVPFAGAVLTDTFQMTESEVKVRLKGGGVFPGLSDGAEAENQLDIQVIISNPPYSVGQEREGDGDANERYEDLDRRVADTYKAQTQATNTKSLDDSYIRAFRWASDRIGDQGIVCFVSGGGWLIGNAMDGMRRCLVEEFAEIYVLDLRGNQRTTQGEKSRREGGKIFGGGSRTAVTITLLVKKKGHAGPGTVRYHDIGDYLSREEKLAKLVEFAEQGPEWTTIVPNEFADWINQRRSDYGQLSPLGDENAKGKESDAIFTTFSMGVSTNRDTWAYSFGEESVKENMSLMAETYALLCEMDPDSDLFRSTIEDARLIKMSSSLTASLNRRKAAPYDPERVVPSLYRPFTLEWVYLDNTYTHRPGLCMKFYRKEQQSPRAIVVSGVGSESGLSCIMTNVVPNLDVVPKSQVFPEFWFDEPDVTGGMFDNPPSEPQRREGISDWAVVQFTKALGRAVDREAIFFYVYGILHSEQFREAYEDNLVKERPRIPLPKHAAQFDAFSEAGRKLADLHLGYENVEPYPLEELCSRPELDPSVLYRVNKMRFPRGQGVKDRPTSILYNDDITLNGIPDEAWDYMLSGKAALYWIMDRYQVKSDKESGIVNDPNEYSDDPRYILDLVKRVITVSLETQRIVAGLPDLGL